MNKTNLNVKMVDQIKHGTLYMNDDIKIRKKKTKERTHASIVSYPCKILRHSSCTSKNCICSCGHGGFK